MRIEPFRAGDLALVDLQPEQAFMASILTPEYAAAVEKAGEAWTAWDGDRPLICAGVAWESGVPRGWAVMAHDAKRALRPALKRMAGYLAKWRHPHMLSIYIRKGWKPGARMAALLGFRPDGSKPETGPDGRDYETWVW